MLRVTILDDPKFPTIKISSFRPFDYVGKQYYVHTAALVVAVEHYHFRLYTDIGSKSKNTKEVNLTQAIKEGVWFVESRGKKNPPIHLKSEVLKYKYFADWMYPGGSTKLYGTSLSKNRPLTLKERLLGKIIN